MGPETETTPVADTLDIDTNDIAPSQSLRVFLIQTQQW